MAIVPHSGGGVRWLPVRSVEPVPVRSVEPVPVRNLANRALCPKVA
jgi:hypothetical protein